MTLCFAEAPLNASQRTLSEGSQLEDFTALGRIFASMLMIAGYGIIQLVVLESLRNSGAQSPTRVHVSAHRQPRRAQRLEQTSSSPNHLPRLKVWRTGLYRKTTHSRGWNRTDNPVISLCDIFFVFCSVSPDCDDAPTDRQTPTTTGDHTGASIF